MRLSFRHVVSVVLALFAIWLLIGITGAAGLNDWQQELVLLVAVASVLGLLLRRSGAIISGRFVFFSLTTVALIFTSAFVPAPYGYIPIVIGLLWFYVGSYLWRRRDARKPQPEAADL